MVRVLLLLLPCVSFPALGQSDSGVDDPATVPSQSEPIMPGQTAAEIDWRPRAQLSEARRHALPAYCEGGYLQPQRITNGQGAGSGGDSGNAPVHASGLSARYELDNQLTLDGDVHLRQGDFTARGSRAEYDQAHGKITLHGPLVSRGNGFLLTGDSAQYNTDSGRFDVNTATFLIHEAEMRGQAETLVRPDDNLVDITSGRLTTCSPRSSAWALVASDIELNRAEGFGTATNVRLEVQDIPVFYWPYASFPIDDRRKTGFLYPQFGTSNTGSGLFFSAPYYLNLAPDYDATVTPQYIYGRGLFNEIEGRYLSDYGESVLQLGYIDKDQDYADTNPGEDGERWGLNFTNQSSFGGGWRGYVDYSAVSDDDYLSDLNRSLEITETTNLLRQGGVRYTSRYQYFEGYLSGYQILNDRISERNRPYDQLPELLYGADYQWGVFETALESQYTYFTRDNDSLTGLDRAIGHRLRVLPEVALNFRALWGYSRPSVTLNHTQYALEDYTAGDGDLSRTIPVYEWDSGLYFDRQSTFFDIPYNQSLEPRLYYAYSEAEDQSGIPDFDTALKRFSFDQLFSPDRFSGGDRVSDNNQLAVAITTRFNDLNTGIERARFSIGQLYYYDDREVTLAGRGGGTRSDSPLAGEAVLRPLDTLDIRVSGIWDARSKKTEIGRSQLVYHSPGYRYLATIGHSYDRDDFEQMDIGTVFPVSDHVSVIGRWVYDSQLDRTVGSLAGLEYTGCCWNVQLISQNYYTSDRTLDHRILFQVQLKGLGSGGGVGNRVSDAIYGFDEREQRRFGKASPGY